MNKPFSKGKANMAQCCDQLTNRTDNAIRRYMRKMIFLCTPLMASVLTGCVQVTAPDKPIVINLNINIKQEVVYRLDGKAKEVIDENAEIF